MLLLPQFPRPGDLYDCWQEINIYNHLHFNFRSVADSHTNDEENFREVRLRHQNFPILSYI